MAVLITWGMGEVGFTVEADTAKEALKVYRGITERTESVAEDRVRQIVNEQTVSVHVDHDSPWSPRVTTYDDPSLLGKMPTVDKPITAEADNFIMPENNGQPYVMEGGKLVNSWIDWVYTDEIPIPTELTIGDLIDVVYRNGTSRYGIPYLNVIPGDTREATARYWYNDDHPCDIVKYRRAV